MFRINGVQFFSHEANHEFLSTDVQLVIGVFCFPSLLCFLLSDHTSLQIVAGLDVTCILVSRPSTHEKLSLGGRLLKIRNHLDPFQLPERVLLASTSQTSSTMLSSKLSTLVFVCLTTSKKFKKNSAFTVSSCKEQPLADSKGSPVAWPKVQGSPQASKLSKLWWSYV